MGLNTATARVRAKRASVCAASCAASLLALVPAAKSQNWTYGADVGVEETDNVSLTPTNTTGQTMATADLDFTLEQQSLRFDTDLKGNFSDKEFLEHAYGNELLGRFDGLAHLLLDSEQLRWTLQEHFGQEQLNPYAPPTPTNLEDVNFVSTGPDLALHLGPTGFLDLSARYARAQYETSPFNSNRAFAGVAWGWRLSSRSSVSLDGNSEHVAFDNTVLNTDFDRSNAYAHYELTGARTNLIASLGATVVDQEGASTSGPLLRLDLTRTLSAASTLTLTAGRQLTDASSSFSAVQSGAINAISTTPAPVTSAPYTTTNAALGWRYERNRTTVAVSARTETDSYAAQPSLDVSRSGVEFSLDHRATRALSAQLLGSLYYTDFAHTNFTSQDALLGLALTLREGRALEFRLRYNYIARIATGIGPGFRENVAFLTIGYRPQHDRDRPTSLPRPTDKYDTIE